MHSTSVQEGNIRSVLTHKSKQEIGRMNFFYHKRLHEQALKNREFIKLLKVFDPFHLDYFAATQKKRIPLMLAGSN